MTDEKKNGDDNEDEEMRLISVNNVNQTIGKGPIVGSEEIKEQILARTSREWKLCLEELWRHCYDKHVCYAKNC